MTQTTTQTFADLQGDTFDIRDVIERFEELEGELSEAHDDSEPNAVLDMRAEHSAIEEFLGDVRGYGGDEQWRGDWYPCGFIRDSYFTEAMRELVSDIGDMPRDIPSYLVIDWDATAENLRADYSSVEIDGVTYWYR